MPCREDCEHLRSFKVGFGQRVLAPYDKRDRKAVCALRPDEELHMRSYPPCWRESEE